MDFTMKVTLHKTLPISIIIIIIEFANSRELNKLLWVDKININYDDYSLDICFNCGLFKNYFSGDKRGIISINTSKNKLSPTCWDNYWIYHYYCSKKCQDIGNYIISNDTVYGDYMYNTYFLM